jgi:predicted lipoprotein with Yx(FWY)xxD motif
MRKGGWAAATGIGSLVLLLAACGGSSSSTSAAGSGSALASSGSSGPAAAASSATPQSTATKTGGSSSSAAPTHSVPAPAPAPRASGDQVSFPPVGTTIMVVQKSSLGYVLAEANGQVVYTYAKDTKNGAPACTGSCAAAWPPVTGTPKAGPADTFPGTFGVVKGAGGVEQITYNGYPLYEFKGAKPLSAAGNGVGGVWHVVPLSASDISGA